MKRYILIFSLFLISFSAKAQSVDFFVTDVNYTEVGSTIKVPVVVSSPNAALSHFEFTIKWDSTALEFVDNLSQDEAVMSWSRFIQHDDSSITYRAVDLSRSAEAGAYLFEFGFEAQREDWISTWIDIDRVKALDIDSVEVPTNFFPGVVYNIVNTSTDNLLVDDLSFDIYPNPINNRIFIKTQSVEYSIRIFDIQGRKVLEERNEYSVEVDFLPSGTYIIEVQDRNIIRRYLRTKI